MLVFICDVKSSFGRGERDEGTHIHHLSEFFSLADEGDQEPSEDERYADISIEEFSQLETIATLLDYIRNNTSSDRHEW